MSTPARTLRWARVCILVDNELRALRDLKDTKHTVEADKLKYEITEFCVEEAEKAAEEGYDHTVRYLRRVIDTLQPAKPQKERGKGMRTPPIDCGNGMQGYLREGVMAYQGRYWRCYPDGYMMPLSEDDLRELGIVSIGETQPPTAR